MIAVDTNILVRYVLLDDPKQAKAAKSFMNGLTASEPAFVCREVLQELVWVLQRNPRFSRQQVAAVVQSMLETEELVIEAADRVAVAVSRYASGGPGFADQMILLAAKAAGAPLATFDSDLARQSGATPIEV